MAAGEMVRRRFPDNTATFALDRLIVYTNVCAPDCPFCAGTRQEGAAGAIVLDAGQVAARAGQLAQAGGSAVVLQGGHHPSLPYEAHLDLCRAVKQAQPGLDLCAFSPSEVIHLAQRSGRRVAQVVQDMREAGVDLLPGGGHEAMRSRQPEALQQLMEPWDLYDGVVQAAAQVGLPMTATLVFGGEDEAEERLMGLLRLRNLQDQTRGVFKAVVPWGLFEGNVRGADPVTGNEYLRWVALTRLFLDNVPHLSASWLSQGPKIAQLALDAGANDLGGAFLDENPLLAAGVSYRLPKDDMARLIADAGRAPARRGGCYQLLERLG